MTRALPRIRWSSRQTITAYVTVRQIAIGRVLPDRPRRSDALAHVADVDPDTLPAEGRDYAEVELLALLDAALATLPQQTAAVVDARLDGLTLREAGERIDRGAERARQLERHALALLREPRHRLVRYVRDERGWWTGEMEAA